MELLIFLMLVVMVALLGATVGGIFAIYTKQE